MIPRGKLSAVQFIQIIDSLKEAGLDLSELQAYDTKKTNDIIFANTPLGGSPYVIYMRNFSEMDLAKVALVQHTMLQCAQEVKDARRENRDANFLPILYTAYQINQDLEKGQLRTSKESDSKEIGRGIYQHLPLDDYNEMIGDFVQRFATRYPPPTSFDPSQVVIPPVVRARGPTSMSLWGASTLHKAIYKLYQNSIKPKVEVVVTPKASEVRAPEAKKGGVSARKKASARGDGTKGPAKTVSEARFKSVEDEKRFVAAEDKFLNSVRSEAKSTADEKVTAPLRAIESLYRDTLTPLRTHAEEVEARAREDLDRASEATPQTVLVETEEQSLREQYTTSLRDAISQSISEYKITYPNEDHHYFEGALDADTPGDLLANINQTFKNLYSTFRVGAHPFALILDKHLREQLTFATEQGKSVYSVVPATLMSARQLRFDFDAHRELAKQQVQAQVESRVLGEQSAQLAARDDSRVTWNRYFSEHEKVSPLLSQYAELKLAEESKDMLASWTKSAVSLTIKPSDVLVLANQDGPLTKLLGETITTVLAQPQARAILQQLEMLDREMKEYEQQLTQDAKNIPSKKMANMADVTLELETVKLIREMRNQKVAELQSEQQSLRSRLVDVLKQDPAIQQIVVVDSTISEVRRVTGTLPETRATSEGTMSLALERLPAILKQDKVKSAQGEAAQRKAVMDSFLEFKAEGRPSLRELFSKRKGIFSATPIKTIERGVLAAEGVSPDLKVAPRKDSRSR